MDSRRIVGLPKFSQEVNDQYCVLSKRWLFVHLDRHFLRYLLNFGRNVVTVSQRFVEETVRTVADDHLVPFVHRCKTFEAGLGIILPVPQGCRRVIVLADTMVRAPSLLATTIITGDIQLIR